MAQQISTNFILDLGDLLVEIIERYISSSDSQIQIGRSNANKGQLNMRNWLLDQETTFLGAITLSIDGREVQTLPRYGLCLQCYSEFGEQAAVEKYGQ